MSIPQGDYHGIPIPKTLEEWRKSQPEGGLCRDVWTPFEEFFQSHNYTLWCGPKDPDSVFKFYLFPPNDHPRAHDGFAYRTRYSKDDREVDRYAALLNVEFLQKTIHCPARTFDNRDVLIRLVQIDGDPTGDDHLTALRRLATGNNAFRGDNHALPVLQELTYNGMTFVVFPLVCPYNGFDRPWYYTFGEVVDAVEQVLEGVNFCHERLVAHLDLDSDNILINFVGGATLDPELYSQGQTIQPFRSYFPIRYFLNDFELAVCFDLGSEPFARVVTGLPTKDKRNGEYGRDVVPEMLLDAPFCPFRADIWQLGNMFNRHLGHIRTSAPLLNLFTEMRYAEPLFRPTAAEALERVRELQREMSPEIRDSRVPTEEEQYLSDD